jgi:hypothetical protein
VDVSSTAADELQSHGGSMGSSFRHTAQRKHDVSGLLPSLGRILCETGAHETVETRWRERRVSNDCRRVLFEDCCDESRL